MTSNLGSTITDPSVSIAEALRQFFRPEFLNRIDEVIEFKHLQKSNLDQIVRIQLKDLEKRLESKNIQMNFSDKLIHWLAEKGYDSVYGARPLKRLIQTAILNKVAKDIISGGIKPDAKCDLDIENNEVVISVK